jgi:hypothetical protein
LADKKTPAKKSAGGEVQIMCCGLGCQFIIPLHAADGYCLHIAFNLLFLYPFRFIKVIIRLFIKLDLSAII